MDQNAKILIVDDMQTMRRLLKSALNDLGYANVVDAEGGTTALSLLESGDYSLVITDWNMPDMEGIDVLKAVRANDKLKHIPVLMGGSQKGADPGSCRGRRQRLRGEAFPARSTQRKTRQPEPHGRQLHTHPG